MIAIKAKNAMTIAGAKRSGQFLGMLTGNQIAAGRALCGFASQEALSKATGVGVATIARAELAKGETPDMGTKAMRKIMLMFESKGVEFYLEQGASAVGGMGMRMKALEK